MTKSHVPKIRVLSIIGLTLFLCLAIMNETYAQTEDTGPRIIGGKKKKRFDMHGAVIPKGKQQPTKIIDGDQRDLDLAVDGNDGVKTVRKPSLLKIKNKKGYTMLPDRASVLKFNKIKDFADGE